MLTKKHRRPQESSKLPLTMAEKKISHMKQQGGGSIPPAQRSHLTEKTCHKEQPPAGQCWPHLPSHSLLVWENFPAMAQLGNGQC